MSLTLRSTKGSPLTHAEADANFSGLADGSLLTGLSASSGSSLVGFIQSGTGAVARTVQSKLLEWVSATDFGLSTSASAATNTTAINNAMAVSKQVFIPAGTYSVNAFNIPANTRLYGEGWLSHLQYPSASPGGNWIGISGVQFVIVEDLWIDGNQSAGPKTAGASLYVVNTENSFVPRRNYVIIRNCRIDVAGFVGIFCSNAHNVVIDSNYIPGTQDTSIAVCVGSSTIQVTNNYTEGCSFGISLSSDGNTNYATTGPVRHCVVSANVCQATKASSYALEFDGIERCVIEGNVALVNGGAEGIRIITSTLIGNSNIVFNDNVVADNIIDFVQDIASTGIEINGPGDITSSRFANNVIGSTSAKVNPNGLLLINGAKVRIDSLTANNVNQAIQIDTNNVASEIWLTNCVVRSCAYGINAPASYANKTTLYINHCDIQGSSTANYNLSNTYNVLAVGTPETTFSSANSKKSISTSGIDNVSIGSVTPSTVAFTVATATQASGTAWQFDTTNAGTNKQTITAGSTYNIATGSGLVLVHNNTTGDMGAFLAYAGTVVKLGGAATIVAGAAGANQIGLAYTGALYQVSNGYGVSEDIYITTIKTRNVN